MELNDNDHIFTIQTYHTFLTLEFGVSTIHDSLSRVVGESESLPYKKARKITIFSLSSLVPLY